MAEVPIVEPSHAASHATTTEHAPGTGLRPRLRTSRGPLLLLKITLLSLFVFPSYMVFAPIGAPGSLPQLLAIYLFGIWAASTILGAHRPLQFDHPGRSALLLLLLATFASYASLHAGWSGSSTEVGRSAADRWVLLMIAITGIAFVTTETLRTIRDVMAVVRWIIAGATFCCLIAVGQFMSHVNLVDALTPLMTGFVDNAGSNPFQARGDFLRVAGTALHSIELGVVISMLLPLAVWRALYDTARWKIYKWGHWLAVLLFIVTNAMTVSRAGMIGFIIALVTTVPFLSKLVRRWTLYLVPAGVAALYVAIPELVRTIYATATAGRSDLSVVYRIEDYPLALRLVSERPLFGAGPGTWIPVLTKDVFDNGYLFMAVTTGLLGLAALILYMTVPPLAALLVARNALSPELKVLAASAAGGGFIAAVATGTFDSFSFPLFALLSSFFVGLSGACWRMFRADEDTRVIESFPSTAGRLPRTNLGA